MIDYVTDMERMLELMEDYVEEYEGTPIEKEIAEFYRVAVELSEHQYLSEQEAYEAVKRVLHDQEGLVSSNWKMKDRMKSEKMAKADKVMKEIKSLVSNARIELSKKVFDANNGMNGNFFYQASNYLYKLTTRLDGATSLMNEKEIDELHIVRRLSEYLKDAKEDCKNLMYYTTRMEEYK
nr:MAG TPA: hypothetical protein [Caudoviricetes sp.]